MKVRDAAVLLSLLVVVVVIAAGCKTDEGGETSGGGETDGGNDAEAMGKPIAPEPDDCITDVNPGEQQLECEGLKFILSVPEACTKEACGLIADVHGYGMDGRFELDHSRIAEHAVEAGFIVINPSAPGSLGTASWSVSNDAQVHAIMQRVIRVFHVDEARIHMAGYSQGGFMSWRFLCAHSDMLASIAPIAAGSGSMGCPIDQEGLPESKVDVFYVHGTTDGLVPFSSAIEQRDALIASWGMEEKELISKGDDHEWKRYENADATVFEFAQHDFRCAFSLGGRPLEGHCFPGSKLLLGCGEETGEVMDWGKSVVDFFTAHPKD